MEGATKYLQYAGNLIMKSIQAYYEYRIRNEKEDQITETLALGNPMRGKD